MGCLRTSDQEWQNRVVTICAVSSAVRSRPVPVLAYRQRSSVSTESVAAISSSSPSLSPPCLVGGGRSADSTPEAELDGGITSGSGEDAVP